MKHTYGTWIAVGGIVKHENDDVADICNCYPDGQRGRSDEEVAANAKLIALAPVMLSVIQNIQEEALMAFGKELSKEVSAHLENIFEDTRFITRYIHE